MIAYIKGILQIKTKGYIVVETNDVGYKVFMSETAISNVGNIGDKIQIYTYMKVREDDVSLYGFITNEELRMFELLLGVSGIGAKGALAILSNITPSKFALAVISNDVNSLKKIPSIGPKTAQRIILELKDKLNKENEFKCDSNIDEEELLKETVTEDNKVSEAISALQVLGYCKRDIMRAIDKIDIKDLTVEDIIRKGLANLSKGL